MFLDELGQSAGTLCIFAVDGWLIRIYTACDAQFGSDFLQGHFSEIAHISIGKYYMEIHKSPYVTRAPHHRYPAGTKCLAWREYGNTGSEICLEFENGEVYRLSGSMWYLEGLEERPWSMWGSFAEQIAKDIDEEIMGKLKEDFDGS
jgi:hypothetical protein